jgi:hypothetical protein
MAPVTDSPGHLAKRHAQTARLAQASPLEHDAIGSHPSRHQLS